MTFLPLCEKRQIKLQNCVFRLELEINTKRLLKNVKLNKSLNCYKLRLEAATVQISLTSKCAMCFVKKSCVIPDVEKYALIIKNSRLVTSVYKYKLLSKIVNMNTFYSLRRKVTKCVSFEPELFPCLTLKCFEVTIRIFNSGSVVYLGIKQEQQLIKAHKFLSDLYIDYCISTNFENI